MSDYIKKTGKVLTPKSMLRSMNKIVIIGGGIAGITAGIFARKNGFDSIILEKHHTVGGECTGWGMSPVGRYVIEHYYLKEWESIIKKKKGPFYWLLSKCQTRPPVLCCSMPG